MFLTGRLLRDRVRLVKSRQSHVLCALGLLWVSPYAAGTDGASSPVSFRRDIAPLIQRRCATCHNEESAKGGYLLDSFARLMTPGDGELPPVVPGKANESEIHQLLIEPSANDRMPQKADPLPAHEIDLIARWINEGAHFDGEAPERPIVELARETLLQPAPSVYPRGVPVTALAFSPDGARIAAPGYYELLIWNAGDSSLARRISGLPERIQSIAWHPQQNLVAIAGGSPAQWGAVLLIDIDAQVAPRFLCDLPEVALSVAFNPDGTRLLAGCGDRSVRLFEIPSGKQLRVFRQHADWVQAVAFSSDGKHFATASRDRTVRVYRAASGELETTYTGHDAPVTDLAFTASSEELLSIARGKSVHLWETRSGKRNAEIGGFPSEIQKIAVRESRLVTAAADGTVRIHTLDGRIPLFALNGHRDYVRSIALSPNGTIATGGHDGEIFIWETRCGTWTNRFSAVPRRDPNAPGSTQTVP